MAEEAIAVDVDFQSASSASSCEELPAAESTHSLTSDSSGEGPILGAMEEEEEEEEEVVRTQAGEPLENGRDKENGRLSETTGVQRGPGEQQTRTNVSCDHAALKVSAGGAVCG